MLYTLGFDIGLDECTFCLLGHASGARLIHCAACVSSTPAFVEVMRYAIERSRDGILVCAVESVILSRIGAAKNLIALSEVCGKILAIAEHLGQSMYRTPAPVWRDRLGLSRQPTDAMVHACILSRVAGWPAEAVFPSGHRQSQTRSHDRDAAGVSLAISTASAEWPPR